MVKIMDTAVIHKGEQMQVQSILDKIISENHFRSVSDLQFYPEEKIIYVQRRMGFKSTVVDISNDTDEKSLRKHLASIPAIY